MTLVVLGNAGLDVTYRLDRLPKPGETLNALDVTEDLGGKGLNQAIAARRAGGAVRFIACVGDDASSVRIRQQLLAEGIADGDLVVRSGRSDHSTIVVDRLGENLIVSDSRRATSLRFAAIEVGLALSAWDILILQGNLALDTTRAAMEAARAVGAKVVFNPAPFEAGHPELSPLVDLLVVNAGEAAVFSGTEDADLWPQRIAVPILVVTLGSGGCLVAERGHAPRRFPAPSTAVVDTVGAGDTFVGTFVAEWAETWDTVRAARLAVAAASEKVTRPGTVSALPTRADIERLRGSIFDGG